jgi:hypothetical protein
MMFSVLSILDDDREKANLECKRCFIQNGNSRSAEVAVPRELFRSILQATGGLRPRVTASG